MAQKTVVTLTDDLDGTPAEETVRFGLDSGAYEIDLSHANAKAFREMFEQYLLVARPQNQGIASARPRVKRGKNDYDPAAVRAWAMHNGHAVNSRGRVSKEVVEAFKAAVN